MWKTRTGKIKLDREWEEMVEEGMEGWIPNTKHF